MSFAHLTLETNDVPGTSRFFQTVMKWPSLAMPGNVDVDADWLKINSNQELHILEIAGAVPPVDQEYGRHVAFFHAGDDFEGVKKRLLEYGMEIIPPIRATPFPRFFFRDPNGYLFELINQDEYQSER